MSIRLFWVLAIPYPERPISGEMRVEDQRNGLKSNHWSLILEVRLGGA